MAIPLKNSWTWRRLPPLYSPVLAGGQVSPTEAYPTLPAFILEVTGETSDVQSHFSTSSGGGGAHFGYGPFSIGGPYSGGETCLFDSRGRHQWIQAEVVLLGFYTT